MNPARLLMLPWYGASSTRWSVGALIFFAALISTALGFASAYTPPLSMDWMRGARYGLAFLNVAMWAALLPNSLLMAYAARRLQMPGAQRDAWLSLSFYALLSIVVPAVLLGVIGGNVAVVAVELVLGAGLGMAFAVFPSYCMSLLFFVALLHGDVWRWLGLPNDMQSGFLLLTAPLATALWLLIMWFCRRALSPQATLDSLHAPLFFLVRVGKWQRLIGTDSVATDPQLAGQMPGWFRVTVDLRGCGPGHVMQTLRVALGEIFMPQTRSSQVRKAVIGLLAGSLFVGLLALQIVGSADKGHGMPAAMGVRFLLMGCVPTLSALLAVITANVLRQRWSRTNGELPLLALLPGLGDSAQIKRALLYASLPPMLYKQVLLLVASLLMAVWWHLGVGSELLLLLGQLCGVALLWALTLMVFAGESLSGSNLGALVVLGMCWFFLPLISVLVLPAIVLVVVFGWVVAAAVLLWLGWRGWRGLQLRPHAFLAN